MATQAHYVRAEADGNKTHNQEPYYMQAEGRAARSAAGL